MNDRTQKNNVTELYERPNVLSPLPPVRVESVAQAQAIMGNDNRAEPPLSTLPHIQSGLYKSLLSVINGNGFALMNGLDGSFICGADDEHDNENVGFLVPIGTKTGGKVNVTVKDSVSAMHFTQSMLGSTIYANMMRKKNQLSESIVIGYFAPELLIYPEIDGPIPVEAVAPYYAKAKHNDLELAKPVVIQYFEIVSGLGRAHNISKDRAADRFIEVTQRGVRVHEVTNPSQPLMKSDAMRKAQQKVAEQLS